MLVRPNEEDLVIKRTLLGTLSFQKAFQNIMNMKGKLKIKHFVWCVFQQ